MREILTLVVTSRLFGSLCLARSDRGICRLDLGLTEDQWAMRFRQGPHQGDTQRGDGSADPTLLKAATQVEAYLSGDRKHFDLPLDLSAGSAFQQQVWEATAAIPFGQVRSYGEIARQIGVPKGARAVGGALGRNPVPIIVPCHRVLRSDGQLGGFGLGIDTKRRLLAIEGRSLPGF